MLVRGRFGRAELTVSSAVVTPPDTAADELKGREAVHDTGSSSKAPHGRNRKPGPSTRDPDGVREAVHIGPCCPSSKF